MKGLICLGDKTRVKLKIIGSEFVVSADEDKSYIVKISNMVDQQIKDILGQSNSMSIAMAAILAALNYCDELEKEKIITQELLKRTEASESLANKIITELDYLRVENEQLREEKLGLHKIIEDMHNGNIPDESLVPQGGEDSPFQLKISLDNDKGDSEIECVRKAPDKYSEHKSGIEIESGSTPPASPEDLMAEEEVPPVRHVGEAQVVKSSAFNMTSRRMLEEKRKALLAQKGGTINGAGKGNVPKPFRPVPSSRSGGGNFSGNSET